MSNLIIYGIMYVMKETSYNKKGYVWSGDQTLSCFVEASEVTGLWNQMLLFYLNSNTITIKNNSNIMINWDVSPFVISITPFFNNPWVKKGKASDSSNVSILLYHNHNIFDLVIFGNSFIKKTKIFFLRYLFNFFSNKSIVIYSKYDIIPNINIEVITRFKLNTWEPYVIR